VVHFYICSVELYGLATKVLLNAIFLKTINRFWNAKSDPKFGHRGEGVSYIDARKKKKRFWNAILVCVLPKNFQNGVPACSVIKIPLVIFYRILEN
jgi:hypothetical protein